MQSQRSLPGKLLVEGGQRYRRGQATRHFLGKAAWGVKNVRGAITVAFLGRLHPLGILAASLVMALTFIGAVGAALTASIRRGGLILAILVLPLMIPTLIFGVSAANAATGGTVPFGTPLMILGALSLIAGVVGTMAAAAALRWGE